MAQTNLVIVELVNAEKSLLAATTIPKTKKVVDFARAAKVYAKEQGLSQSCIDLAHALHIHALSQLGDMLKIMEKNKGGGEPGIGRAGRNAIPKKNCIPPTLKELGVDLKTSMVAQQLAGLPENVREQIARQEKTVKEALGPHVAKNTGEHEWYTPATYIKLARDVMGSIDCDPASSAIANNTVKASVYYTAEQNGLQKPWMGNVWLNPPYAQPLINQFVEKFLEELRYGDIREACVLVNNATETEWCQSLMEYATAIFFPKTRIRFLDPEGQPGAPLQGQIFFYYGNSEELLYQMCTTLGRVLFPVDKPGGYSVFPDGTTTRPPIWDRRHGV